MARATISPFWLAIATGKPLSPAWRWKDRAPGLPSWAPTFLQALEQTGNVTASVTKAGRPLRSVYVTCCLLPQLRSYARAALVRYHHAQLVLHAQQLGNSPKSALRRSAATAHPLEVVSMHQWMRLSHAEQVAVVVDYAGRTPRMGGIGDVRRWR